MFWLCCMMLVIRGVGRKLAKEAQIKSARIDPSTLLRTEGAVEMLPI